MKATANGEIFDMDAVTRGPYDSAAAVDGGGDQPRQRPQARVRVNDRGPFVDGRIIDLSHAAAQELGYDRKGMARVRVRYLGPAPLAGTRTPRALRPA